MRRHPLATATVGFAVLFGTLTPAISATVAPGTIVAAGPQTKLEVEPVQYFRRCVAWRSECSRRHGYRTYRYFACMRFHAC